MTITGLTALADVSGTCSVSVWKDTYDPGYPPTVADEISGTEDPGVSAAIKGQDLTLSSWTTAVAAGETIGFNVTSNPCTSVTRLHIIIRGNKT